MTAHGLSFDVEDWHQLEAIRVDGCVGRILDLCDEAGVQRDRSSCPQ